jgi:phosphohistidine phosphatase
MAKFNLEELYSHCLQSDVYAESPGGGRISISEADKTIKIYGYSQGFGRANHAVTQEIIEKSG